MRICRRQFGTASPINSITGATIAHPTDAHCSNGVEYEDERES
ncbi:protein of unknown function [Xenorhabdus bovienii]|uniref:Uncharacterized protein n=1 Tax=Xenorhabdus bovienii TaxID=40576 RepID=A0A0B6XAM6_XENBV|nr:protein of unknown function [Xenorhabdus bovienii]